jgi:hypothetical protein
VSEKVVRDIFTSLAGVKVVDINLKKHTQDPINMRQTGYGFGYFYNMEDAFKVINLVKGKVIYGITFDSHYCYNPEYKVKQASTFPSHQPSSNEVHFYPGQPNLSQMTLSSPHTITYSPPNKPTQQVTHLSGMSKPVSFTPPQSNSLGASSIASYAFKPTEGYARKTVEQLQKELVEQRKSEMNISLQANIQPSATQKAISSYSLGQKRYENITPLNSNPILSSIPQKPCSPLDSSAFQLTDNSFNYDLSPFNTGTVASGHSFCSHDSYKSLSNSELDEGPGNNLRFDASNDILFWK